MKLHPDQWTLGHLREHLQCAAALEAWTIPYYMSALLSIVSRSSPAYQLIQSVVHQEMLHLQLVANVANAYGLSPVIDTEMFSYSGETIPHLDFDLNPDHPGKTYTPHSVEIGPLDELRINAMCLIEYPGWVTGVKREYRDDVTEYGSIGEFYDALEYGARQHASHIVGGIRQVDMFSAFYRRLPRLTVESSGAEGLAQVELLLNVIRDHGEAAKAADPIHPRHQNTATESQPELSHYDKFRLIRSQPLPETYPVKHPAEYTTDDHKRVRILVDNFARLGHALGELFAGKNPGDFAPLMVTIGANILACWKSGVTPKFT